MFYEFQSEEQKNNYKRMLKIVGKLSRLYSTAKEPYLYYRVHENVFAKYFDAENNSRSDDSADACVTRENGHRAGIGLKTWVGQDNQKVAEFGRLRPSYADLDGMDLILKIAEYRNKRIITTMNSHGLHEMIYHIVKRVPGMMCIYESAFDLIDIDNIVLDLNRGNANSIYFFDGKHIYHFSKSKNTLYMIFDDMVLLDEFEVDIEEDPYTLLENLMSDDFPGEKNIQINENSCKDQLCLRLYSTRYNGEKFVAEKSGLNQGIGARTQYKTDENGERVLVKVIPRNPNELYIPYPAEDRARKNFFPPRDECFELILPDGKIISAKVCQQDSKAIMSNPNSALGKWLLRDVFNLPEGTKVTYQMLKEYGIDSVIFTKLEEKKYTIDFCRIGTYEKFYGLEDSEAYLDELNN